jgi:hypothetical protein
MGIEIQLHGHITSKVHRPGRAAADALLNLVQEWWGDDLLDAQLHAEGGDTRLDLLTHPLAEPMEIFIPRRGEIEVAVRTSTVGPGYHQRVCEFCHHLSGVFGIDWSDDEDQDETGYFATVDRASLEKAMFDWLQAVCASCLEHIVPGEHPPRLCMPVDQHFHTPGFIQTPTGPRTMAWLQAVAADPSGPEGRSFFSAWSAERTPAELLSRALAHMWMDIFWVPPQSGHSERALVAAADLLAEAYRADPTLDYPWPEWAEILECLGQDDDPLAASVRELASGRAATIGYRRGLTTFREAPGPWSITLPGRFESDWEDEETWLATDGLDVVRMTGVELESQDDSVQPLILLQGLAPEGRIVDEWSDEDHIGAAVLMRDEEDGDEFWVLYACIRWGRHYAQVTVITSGEPQEAWIKEACRSVVARGED